MADNINITPGSGITARADDVGGVKYQVVKLDGGGDGVSIPIEAGTQANASSLPIVLSTENQALVGSLTETAPGTDTASSGLNGRLQRIAQRITSLIALLPTALGANGGLKVEGVASGTKIPVQITDGTNSAGVKDTGSSDALMVAVVDASGGQITSFGGGTEYTEDAASAANPVGTALILVREDARAGSLTSADGDNVAARGNNKGEMYVKVTDSDALLTTIDTDTGNIATAVEIMDDWDESDRAKVNIIAGQAGVTAGAGAVAANTPRVTHASDDPAVTALQIMDDWDNAASDGASVSGDVAHDAVDAGEPVKIGGKALTANPTAVATGDRVNSLMDIIGRAVVAHNTLHENISSGAITTAMTGTTSTQLLAAPGAGLRWYITSIIVSNAHASTGTDLAIQDGSGGTTFHTLPAAAAYGGTAIQFTVPLPQPTANTALYCANVTTGASTKVSVVAYKGV